MEAAAVDTNVVIRFLVEDDPAENKRAANLFASGPVFIPETVLMESEWVLRAAYEFAPGEIAEAFDRLLRLPAVLVDDRPALLEVLERFRAGFDFADSLHYARCQGAELKTFDKKFLKLGRRRNLKVSAP